MEEQIFRQPLSVIPPSRPNPNIAVFAHTPSKVNKRATVSADLDVAVTPTRASATPAATNGRRSVKRVKVELSNADTDTNPETETDSALVRAKAEAEHAAKLKIWISSYKKQFPNLRFYFDACSDEDVRRCTRKIVALGGVRSALSNLY